MWTVEATQCQILGIFPSLEFIVSSYSFTSRHCSFLHTLLQKKIFEKSCFLSSLAYTVRDLKYVFFKFEISWTSWIFFLVEILERFFFTLVVSLLIHSSVKDMKSFSYRNLYVMAVIINLENWYCCQLNKTVLQGFFSISCSKNF